MPNLLNLKQAIQTALENEFYDLTTGLFTPSVNILTGEDEYSIAEVYGETSATVPSINYDIINAIPLTEDDPTTGCFISTVFIYTISHNSIKTTRMADKISQFFTLRPVGEGSNWFRDLSDDCLVNKFTKYVNRRSTKPKNNYKTDTYGEFIEIEMIWCNCNCDQEICEDELVDDCPIDLGESDYYDIEDDCDNC